MADNLQTPDTEPPADLLTTAALEHIQLALQGLRFGQVLIAVHEGVIVQIERTERTRISRMGETP